ncbi:MAG: PhzF family phenazine biosynthesis protein [Anaerolineae bacterium]|nr:PhzF family phenazine biosynthesis protein [Anaerolineae bacterium]
MNTRIIQVDAFTHQPFRGNPAGVCLLEGQASAAWMQAVAAEMNLSETAFLCPHSDGFDIRYFTPLVEVPLCGHATLASAHVLWEESLASTDGPIPLQAPAGPLTARRESDWICLDFPAYPVSPAGSPVDLAGVLGAEPQAVHRLPTHGYLLELDSEDTVRDLQPDFSGMRRQQLGGVIVTARCDGTKYDFVSRFFAPDIGIDEDPVTGVAHCSLGPYWADRLGKRELVGHQVSRRGGVVRVRVRGSRVDILGQAVTVIRGHIASETL